MPFMSGAFIGLENLQTRLTDHYQSQHGSFFSFRSSSTNKNPLPTDIDLSNEESKRRLFNRFILGYFVHYLSHLSRSLSRLLAFD